MTRYFQVKIPPFISHLFLSFFYYFVYFPFQILIAYSFQYEFLLPQLAFYQKFQLFIFFNFAGLDSLLARFCKLLGQVNLVLDVFFKEFFIAQGFVVVEKPNHLRNLIFFIHRKVLILYVIFFSLFVLFLIFFSSKVIFFHIEQSMNHLIEGFKKQY